MTYVYTYIDPTSTPTMSLVSRVPYRMLVGITTTLGSELLVPEPPRNVLTHPQEFYVDGASQLGRGYTKCRPDLSAPDLRQLRATVTPIVQVELWGTV